MTASAPVKTREETEAPTGPCDLPRELHSSGLLDVDGCLALLLPPERPAAGSGGRGTLAEGGGLPKAIQKLVAASRPVDYFP